MVGLHSDLNTVGIHSDPDGHRSVVKQKLRFWITSYKRHEILFFLIVLIHWLTNAKIEKKNDEFFCHTQLRGIDFLLHNEVKK